MTARDFERFQKLILDCYGISLSNAKVLLLENRIGKRLQALGLRTFHDYYLLLQTPEGKRKELTSLGVAITTNETYFFREPHHFEVLKRKLLPELCKLRRPARVIRVWSAGCSAGQEAFSIGMVLDEYLRPRAWKYEIQGSDIDVEVLKTASSARYPVDAKKKIPGKYALRYCEEKNGEVLIKDELSKHVTFRHENLSVASARRPRVDLIFCRNMLIYFHQNTRTSLARVFWDSLRNGGFLIVGTSESLQGTGHEFTVSRVNKCTVYSKPSRFGATNGNG